MNIQQALEELELIDSTLPITKTLIKKQFHKLALKWHPDKNVSSNAKAKFQKINDAYSCLLNEYDTDANGDESDVNDDNNTEDNMDTYIKMLTSFLSSIFQEGTYGELLKNIVKDISIGYELTYTYLKRKFESLDKHRAVELYQFLHKYQHLLYISDELLTFVSSIIEEKLNTNDKVILLKPSLKDLINDNVYKLYVNEKLYLVPLWHNELYFDMGTTGECEFNELVVLCQPELPPNIIIDEDNNIFCEMLVKLSGQLLIEPHIILTLGDKEFKIPLKDLYLKERQQYVFKSQGISKIVENDIYNVSRRANVIVYITLY